MNKDRCVNIEVNGLHVIVRTDKDTLPAETVERIKEWVNKVKSSESQ